MNAARGGGLAALAHAMAVERAESAVLGAEEMLERTLKVTRAFLGQIETRVTAGASASELRALASSFRDTVFCGRESLGLSGGSGAGRVNVSVYSGQVVVSAGEVSAEPAPLLVDA